jgi:hypothetical protein
VSNRFDNRSVSTFKKDIKFGTMLEKYFFETWMGNVNHVYKGLDFHIDSWENNGCGNDGEFIASGNTAGADYKVNDVPLEVKWVPTAGKLTLKRDDMQAYSREKAAILFIYNTGKANLRKPKDYDLERHIKLVESQSQHIRWGVMSANNVEFLHDDWYRHKEYRPIPYMGNKYGKIIESKDFNKYFVEREW